MIVKDPNVCSGHPIIQYTRMTVHDIVAYVNMYGGNAEEARLEEMSQLTPAEVAEALAYYAENREEIDRLLVQRKADYESLPSLEEVLGT